MFDYTAVAAKCRAMAGNLLTPGDYAALASCKSVGDIAEYLGRTQNYGDYFAAALRGGITRSRVEYAVKSAQLNDSLRILTFSSGRGRDYMRLLLAKYENELLLNIWHSIGAPNSPSPGRPGETSLNIKALSAIDSSIDAAKLVAAGEASDAGLFLEALSGTAYRDIFSRDIPGGSGAIIETEIFKKYYFDLHEKAGDFAASDAAAIREAVGARADFINIMRIYRLTRNFGMEPSLLPAYYIPVGYKLKRDDIAALAATGDSQGFAAAISQTYYGRRSPFTAGESLTAYADGFTHSLMRRRMHGGAGGFALAVYYFFMRQEETESIVRITEGVRYGMEPGAILRGLPGA